MRLLVIWLCLQGSLPAFGQNTVDVLREPASTGRNTANRFSVGYASVTVNGRSFYIDERGAKAFDAIDEQDAHKLGDGVSIAEYRDNAAQYPEHMPKPVVKVWKDGLVGLIDPTGEWVLPAVYEDIDLRMPEVWKVKQQGRESYYGKSGLLLPFFDEMGYLDGVHFDVRTGEKWGVYSLASAKLVVPAQYDRFDYCGGCGRKPTYLLAQRDGKWGAIDFEGKVLVGFAYDHEHWGMRSDEWIQSFSKGGRNVLVHIPTGKEYPLAEGESHRFLAGSLLAYATGGKFGLIDKDGRQVLPAEYDDIMIPNDDYYLGYRGPYSLIRKGGKTGVIQRDGKVLFQPEWDDVMVYDDFFVLTKAGRSALYDNAGNELLPAAYSEITHVNDYFYSSGSKGVSVFKTKEKALYGLYFPETNVSVKPVFHSVDIEYGNRSLRGVRIEGENQGRTALFDGDGTELLPLRYRQWSELDTSAALLKVELNDRWGLYDIRLQQEVIPCSYDQLDRLDRTPLIRLGVGDYANRNLSIWRENGEALPTGEFSDLDRVGEHVYLLRREDGTDGRLLNGLSGELHKLAWKYAWNLDARDLLLVSDDGATGSLYHVETGVLEGKYDVSAYANLNADAPGKQHNNPRLLRFSKGFGEIGVDNKVGFVDSLGRQVFAPQFDQATAFNAQGIAAVGKHRSATDAWGRVVTTTSYGFVKKTGDMIAPPDFPAPQSYFWDMDFFMGEYLVSRKASADGQGILMGLLDGHGHTVLEPVYDAIESLRGGRYFLLQQGKRFNIADSNGKIILPEALDDLMVYRQAADDEQLFPLLGKGPSGWRYYTAEGTVLVVEGTADADVFEVNQWGW